MRGQTQSEFCHIFPPFCQTRFLGQSRLTQNPSMPRCTLEWVRSIVSKPIVEDQSFAGSFFPFDFFLSSTHRGERTRGRSFPLTSTPRPPDLASTDHARPESRWTRARREGATLRPNSRPRPPICTLFRCRKGIAGVGTWRTISGRGRLKTPPWALKYAAARFVFLWQEDRRIY